MSEPLDWLALRVASEPFFMAYRLADYQARRGLSDLELADELRCRAEDLTMVRLCRAPREGVNGTEDVRCVAERFGCDVARLAAALRVRWG
jgi:hypothetical protein